MLNLKAKIALLTPLTLFALVFLPATAYAAPQRSECNKTSNPAKCKRDFDSCNNNACKQNVIDQAKKNTNVGIGGNGAGGGKNGGQSKQNDGYQCGNLPDDNDNVKTKINFGCLGKKAPDGMGPIQDLVFALIRFLSVGVGLAVVISIIIAGIQYATSEGNPETSQKAKLRIQQALIGLGIYIFAWSILQFLIPGGLFR